VPGDGSYELKHVAPHFVKLKCVVERCIAVVCGIEKRDVSELKRLKSPATKFHGNPSTERRAYTYRQTTMTKLIGVSYKYA